MGVTLFMKDANVTLKVGVGAAKAYQGQIGLAQIKVAPGSVVTYPTLDGTAQSQIGPSTYSLDLKAGQVWDATAGLAAFLWANEGAIADFTLQAHGQGIAPSTTQPYVTGQCRIVAPAYGGEVGKYAELDISMPCITKPTLATTGTLPAMADAQAAEADQEAPAEAVA